MKILTKTGKFSWVGDVAVLLLTFIVANLLVGAILSLFGIVIPTLSAIDEVPIETYISEQEAFAKYNAIFYPLMMSIPIVLMWLYVRLRGGKKAIRIRHSVAGFNPSVILVGVVWLLSSQILLEPLVALLPQQQNPGVGLGVWAYVTALVSAPILEEVLCRGVLFETFRRRLGVKMSILLSALFFGLIHFDTATMIVATVAGVIFGVLYVRTSSIFAPIIVHSINNAMAFSLLVLGKEEVSFREMIGNDALYYIVYGVAATIFAVASLEAFFKVLRLGRKSRKIADIKQDNQEVKQMKKRVFLTGATGVMGTATLTELLARGDQFDVTVLALNSKKNRKKLARYGDKISVVWGNLMNYDDVLKGVSGADYVLHVGGLVSPRADYTPKSVLEVNVTAAENVVKAVKAQPNSDEIKVAYIGSVAQTGDRREPLHWGRTGDPIFPSIFDYYAISKCRAERIFAESGLKHWVSLRQSGILYPAILKNMDPIMFHVPIRGVLEWATVEDSGRLMAKLCEDGLPEDFWCKFYNIGSGAEYRLTNYDFERYLLKSINCPAPEKIFDVKWFATHNFHGQFYFDSDKLEEYLHFRANTPVEEYFAQMSKTLPWFYSLAKIAPAWLIKPFMRIIANDKIFGTLGWLKKGNEERIRAYFGSREEREAIGSWKEMSDIHLAGEAEAERLSHGYDETKPLSELDIEDMRQAAAFRGGKCLSETMVKGDLSTKLEWECAFGHRFLASPTLILLGGHWCEECMPAPWRFDEEAEHNPFLAQVWDKMRPNRDGVHHTYGTATPKDYK